MSATIAYSPFDGDLAEPERTVYIVTGYAPESPLGSWLLTHAAEQYPGRRIVYQHTAPRGEEVHNG